MDFEWGKDSIADTYRRIFVLKVSLTLSAVFSILFGISESYKMAICLGPCLILSPMDFFQEARWFFEEEYRSTRGTIRSFASLYFSLILFLRLLFHSHRKLFPWVGIGFLSRRDNPANRWATGRTEESTSWNTGMKWGACVELFQPNLKVQLLNC
jgi:hypothetical protein